MTYNTKYSLGDTVYLTTDTEQLKRMITYITICPAGVTYGLCQGTTFTEHYEIELSNTADAMVRMGIDTNSQG